LSRRRRRAAKGAPLIFLIALLAFLALIAIGSRRKGQVTSRLGVACRIALGIGLHNLGEGLAIGAAFATGSAALGTFLVIGFTLHNITEGIGIAAPIARERPKLWHFVALAALAGLKRCWGLDRWLRLQQPGGGGVPGARRWRNRPGGLRSRAADSPSERRRWQPCPLASHFRRVCRRYCDHVRDRTIGRMSVSPPVKRWLYRRSPYAETTRRSARSAIGQTHPNRRSLLGAVLPTPLRALARSSNCSMVSAARLIIGSPSLATWPAHRNMSRPTWFRLF
jgi:hypothetical protein